MIDGTTGSQPGFLLSDLADEARRTGGRFAAEDDWMSRANAESALALSKMASDAAVGAPARARWRMHLMNTTLRRILK
jgi:hypothetical protein